MKKYENLSVTLKRRVIILNFLFFIILGCAAFPIYNLNKEWSTTLTISILISSIGTYGLLGITERLLLPNSKVQNIILINLAIILLGMLCRYLLEFGEVSNTYNFTVPNMILHIGASLVISTIAWAEYSSENI